MSSAYPPPPGSDDPNSGQSGQPNYGQGQEGQPSYGQPAYGQPSYGQPAYGSGGGMPPYGQGGGYGGGHGTPPPNHLVWAILSTVFCCLPLGIVSIVFAAQVNGKYQSGDIAGAQESSEKAKKFAIWSAITSVILIVLYVIFIVIVGAIGTSSSDF